MKTAFGALGWSPETFWACTMTELFIAIEGFNEANGAKPKVEAPSNEDLADLVARYG